MKKLIVFIPVLLLSFLVNTKLEAQVLDKVSSRTYEVKDDYVLVTENKTVNVTEAGWRIPAGETEVFTVFYPNATDPNVSSKIEETKKSLLLKDNSGNVLNYTAEETSSKNLIIKYTLQNDITYGNGINITLSYKAYGLLIRSGNLRDVYIPSFPKDYSFTSDSKKETVNTKVIVPKGFGEINFISPTVPVGSDETNWFIDIPQENLIGETNWIQIGTTQYYSFKISQNYNASTNLPFGFNEYKIPLPRDTVSGPIIQQVFYKNFSIKPYLINTDADGNLIAIFRVPAKDSGVIEIEGYASLTQDKNFKINESGDISDISNAIITANTKPAKYWESDNEQIKEIAQQIKGDETNVYRLTQKTYEYVVNLIDYDKTKKFGVNNQRQGALKTLQGGAAVCMEYSDLFITLMRANGLPTRAAFGHGFSAIDDNLNTTQGFNHQWAEVYLPALNRWVNVDTTWGENGPSLIGGDLNHLYLHVASVDPETPSSVEVRYVGDLGTIPEQESVVSTLENIPQDRSDLLTQEELLQKYPAQSKTTQTFNNIADSVKLMFTSLDNGVNKLVLEVFPGLSQNVINIAKLIILVVIVILFLLLKVGLPLKKKRKVKQKNLLYTS